MVRLITSPTGMRRKNDGPSVCSFARRAERISYSTLRPALNNTTRDWTRNKTATTVRPTRMAPTVEVSENRP